MDRTDVVLQARTVYVLPTRFFCRAGRPPFKPGHGCRKLFILIKGAALMEIIYRPIGHHSHTLC
jgi:hypothetical protein